MTDQEAMDEVQYPIVSLPSGFRDERGIIQNLFVDGMQSGALITSKKGSRRADHYHRTGNHLCLLLSGRLLYKWRKHGEPEWNKRVIEAGQAFYSPAMVDHAMVFLQDSMFLAFDSKVTRSPTGYEEDIVRFKPPDHEVKEDAEFVERGGA